jgi:hypothetical protein
LGLFFDVDFFCSRAVELDGERGERSREEKKRKEKRFIRDG